MIDIHAASQEIGNVRRRSLGQSAYRLRQHAINIGGDLEGWRLARRMRDAVTVPQVNAAEREFGVYVRTHVMGPSMAA